MRILVTGAQGFLGSSIVNLFSAHGHDLLASTRNVNSKIFLNNDNVQVISNSDLINLESLSKYGDIDLIIHCAGMNAEACTNDPIGAFMVNSYETAKLFEIAEIIGIPRFIFMSTSHVYLQSVDGHIDENSCTGNVHPYASSKLAAENLILNLSKQYACVKLSILRLSNVVGMPNTNDLSRWNLFVPNICAQAVVNKEIVLTGEINDVRDYFPMKNFLVAMHELVMKKTNEHSRVIFNLGSGVTAKNISIAQKVRDILKKMTGQSTEIKFQYSSFDNKPYKYSVDRISKCLGLKISDFEHYDALDYEIERMLLTCMEDMT